MPVYVFILRRPNDDVYTLEAGEGQGEKPI
jgi:hypothetical protein